MVTSPRTNGTGDEGAPDRGLPGRPPRRRVLAGAVTTSALALAGCSGLFGGPGGEEQGPDAVTLTDDDTCDVCGMVIPNHPGPSSEIFYADREPNGHANPARFDSTWEAFEFDFGHEDWTRQAFYVTDYSAVDYEIRTDQGQHLISRHVEAGAFAAAADVTFVADSAVVGAMGRDLLGFSERADAEAFRDEHGGDLLALEDVTPTLISQLGE
jgi:nitrous oxide reductase accessory protein NosL